MFVYYVERFLPFLWLGIFSDFLWLPLFSFGWETGTIAAPPLYEWFLAFIPQKAQRAQVHIQLAGSSREQQLSLIPLLWTSKGPLVGHKGYVDESFQITFYFASFLFASPKRNNSNLINLPSKRVFLRSSYVCCHSLNLFYFLCYYLEQRWIEQQK